MDRRAAASCEPAAGFAGRLGKGIDLFYGGGRPYTLFENPVHRVSLLRRHPALRLISENAGIPAAHRKARKIRRRASGEGISVRGSVEGRATGHGARGSMA